MAKIATTSGSCGITSYAITSYAITQQHDSRRMGMTSRAPPIGASVPRPNIDKYWNIAVVRTWQSLEHSSRWNIAVVST